MKKLLFQSGILLLLLALMSEGHAQNTRYIPVFCDQGHSLQDALDRATDGASLDVYGTCNEAVVVRTDRLSIGAFFGQTTNINPPAGSVAFTVLADHVEISNLNITGGTSAVHIEKGSSATIRDNHIFDSTEFAVDISAGSYGEISGNDFHSTIIGNPNLSQIIVTNSGNADILNNTINASSGFGIIAIANGSALVNGNDVSFATASAGIFVGGNSSMIFNASNKVRTFGGPTIVCGVSGFLFVRAVQDVLPGTAFVDPSCDLLNPSGAPFPP